MKYFALDVNGEMWDLCDCGDYQAAEEVAASIGVDPLWIADEYTAIQWMSRLRKGLDEPVLSPDEDEPGTDFVFNGESGSYCWITIGGISVSIKREERDRVEVKLYDLHHEMSAPLGSVFAYPTTRELNEA